MSVYFKEKPGYLEVCLESLLNQSLLADEIVLVEDGDISSDLLLVINKYRECLNIISVPLAQNVGLASALNEGLKYCQYDLVARMDTDDIAVVDRFEKQVAYMQENPDIAASSGLIEEFNDTDDIFLQRVLPTTHDELVKFSKKRSPLSHPAVIFRKQVIIDVGGYPEIYPEDYLMWVKLIQSSYKIANISDLLVKMRTGNDFISRRGWMFLKGELRIYHYMFETGFINFFEFINIIAIKSVLRLSPSFIKVLLYKVMR